MTLTLASIANVFAQEGDRSVSLMTILIVLGIIALLVVIFGRGRWGR